MAAVPLPGRVYPAPTASLKNNFNVKIFELILLVVAAIAIFFLIMSCALFVSHRRR